jgi:hypothetical protein
MQSKLHAPNATQLLANESKFISSVFNYSRAPNQQMNNSVVLLLQLN